MKRDETITITTEEYKALMAKEQPSEKDKMLLNTIIETIKDHADIVEMESYYSHYKGITIKDRDEAVKEILMAIFAIDRPRFIEMYKDLSRGKREDEIKKLNMEHARRMKEIQGEE